MDKKLEVEKRPKQNIKITKEIEQLSRPKDIVITKYRTDIDYDKDGNEIKKRTPVTVNITKKMNESKKLVKKFTAEEKLEELEKIFTK